MISKLLDLYIYYVTIIHYKGATTDDRTNRLYMFQEATNNIFNNFLYLINQYCVIRNMK